MRPAVTLLLLVAVSLSACARYTDVTPAPEYFDAMAPLFTVGVPEEQPLPPLIQDGLSQEELSRIQVHRQAHRGVVSVTTLSAYHSRWAGTVPVAGAGSGAIVDGRGVVVTNHHVVAGAQRLIITLYDGSLYPARLIGSDPEMDLAVLRFDPMGRSLTVLPFADSGRLQVGQSVLAMGNPFGLEGTLTAGVISALNRPVQLQSGFIIRDLIQSDAAINPGNSGGPLLNGQGQLVGINSMLIGPSAGSVGISLSIPANAVRRITHQILKEGRVVRGWIEIEGLALNERLSRQAGIPPGQGILVTRVKPGGNAERAGLRDGQDGRMIRHGAHRIPVEGDVITAINGEPVASVAELFALLEETRPGDRAELRIRRGGRSQTVEIELGQRPSFQ
ncbi:S1-C subfamily serine protease [Natronospira proteinivora]|uniref:S1-C subfamily serine protease n=1 Tax=Natronospira proteinivora TaxID=1807133 RepID=A0ABT1G6W7_9GAMM|nr:trypsin-like peptidase domain-containing protein [Natronospira proteinivora]MCP1727049.1 S1-C subfamily serine protease [Natronospira proteinivora]